MSVAKLTRAKPGRDGRDGRDGIDGKEGAPGPRGDRGERGFTGPQGRHGRDGIDGKDSTVPGPPGPPGRDGVDGKPGLDGINGKDSTVPGPRGLRGPKGEQGEQGPKGDPGEMGPMPDHEWRGTALRFQYQDARGETRWGPLVDLQGPKGERGRSGGVVAGGGGGEGGGEQGPQGPQGETGPAGPAGAAGEDGRTVLSGNGSPLGETQSLFTTEEPVNDSSTDGVPYEMGMKFQVARPGYITAIRYWKAVGEVGTHTGRIWSAGGTELASAEFLSEIGNGWQQQALDPPLAIAANTTYVVSVNIEDRYAVTVSGLATQITNGDVSSVDDGSNGVFGDPATFPTNSFSEGNYFRDIVFAADQVEANPGDFYIDLDTYYIYGPYEAGSWGEGVDLQGADGAGGLPGADGPAGPTGPAGAAGGRNLIINGDMRMDQRNGGTSLNVTASGYCLDRWRYIRAGAGTLATMTVQRVTTTPHPDYTSALVVAFSSGATLAASSQHGLLQHIEGVNAARLKWGSADAKSLTISFLVRASVTGTYPVSVCNSAANRSYVGEYTINAAFTWEAKSITIPGDTSGTWLVDTGKGVTVYLGHGDGSNFNTPAVNTWQAGNYTRDSTHVTPATTSSAQWRITAVQAEIGSAATEFEHVSFDELVRRCQRYYYKTFPIDQAPAQAGGGGDYWYFTQSKAGTSTADMWAAMRLPIMMRATPTVTGYNPVSANAHPRNYSRSSDTSASALGAGPTEVHVTYTSVSNAAVGDLHFYNISADAELV